MHVFLRVFHVSVSGRVGVVYVCVSVGFPECR